MNHYEDIAQALGVRPAVQSEQATYRVASERREVSFSVSALPVPQPRQRHRVVRAGPKAYATNYTPAKHPVQALKAAIALAARQAMQGQPPLQGPLAVRMLFRFPLPASARVLTKRIVAAGAYVPYYANKRNDGDNLMKVVLDSVTGICWADDGQVSRWSGEKVYAKEAGVDIWVGEWA